MTPERAATLPDDLLSARDCAELGKHFDVGLLTLAADRICELEEKVLELRCAIAAHRASKDFSGEKEPCDRHLWQHVKDVPWAAVRGDG
ncbi:MAG: hypothetical protein ACKO04_03535 [Actinomycetes bacterium]